MNNANQLPYELLFCHRFNLHKLLGFEIDDEDLKSIARVYGVELAELEEADKELRERVRTAAEIIREKLGDIRPKTLHGGPVTYLALGDSITSDRTSYAKIIRHLWEDSNVIDAGISGDTVSDIVNRFYGDVLANTFEIASIFIGTNDSRGINDGSGITNTSLSEYETKLDYFLQKLKARGKSVLVITLPPADNDAIYSYFGDDSNWTYNAEHVKKMNTVIRKSAEKNGAVLVDLALEVESSGINPLDEDGLHLNIEAHTLLASMILKKMSGI